MGNKKEKKPLSKTELLKMIREMKIGDKLKLTAIKRESTSIKLETNNKC